MTICDKIQTIGNSLEENLNERGIQCTFGKKSGESTIYDMVNFINDTNFKGSSDVNLKISANRPYLLAGETTDVVVKLENGLCKPLKNKNVAIEQSIFIDNGTTASHNDHWYINSNGSYGTATVQSDGTKLLNTSGNTTFAMRSIIPSNKTLTEANCYSYNPPYIVEFDIVETNGTSNSDAQVQVYSQQTNSNFTQGLTTGHYKIEVTSQEQKIWIDDTLIKTTNLSLPNARITLRVRNSKYLIYKNFKVYEIINGVTDEKGEFALYNVSVTDDTTFTASYGTETVTTNVYLCKMVDYGVTSNSKINYWYWNSNYGIGSVSDSGTTFTGTSTNYYLTSSALTTEIYPNLNIYIYDFPLTIEFDILSFNDQFGVTDYSRVRVYNNANNKNAFWNFKDFGVGHYKIVCTEGNQKLYYNGVEQSRKFTFTPTTAWNVAFQTKGHIKFHNLAIY